MTEGGEPLPGQGGMPVVRGFFLPARHWQIEDTWYVAGLKATGSHHIALKDAVVPAENFFDFPGGVPCLPGPLYQSIRQLLPLLQGAFAVAMAEGALDELVGLANTGRQQLRAAVPMRESETFQGELGRVTADLRAARGVARGPGRKPLAPRACRNAEE
jgi:indole-3-acetate monooxygenase